MDSQLIGTWTKLHAALLSLLSVSVTVLTVDFAVKGAVPVPGGKSSAARDRARGPDTPR